MNQQLLEHISSLLCVHINAVTALSGGDISKVYLLETTTERFVCKVNETDSALKLFQSEKEGLEAIRATKTIATPKIYRCGALENGAFLLMEYIEPKRPVALDMGLQGHQLAAMHGAKGSATFGWTSTNFMGSLPQSNTVHASWASFYVLERLSPQLKLAVDRQLLTCKEVPSEEKLLERFSMLSDEVRPALLHGDLWGGNFLIRTSGSPYLIDPAVYYGHAEVDMAMTNLFGGFSNSFYAAYREHIPRPKNGEELTDLYQLYYLLVHLNLFGASYYAQVTNLLQRYF